jgi:hypothetical protein
MYWSTTGHYRNHYDHGWAEIDGYDIIMLPRLGGFLPTNRDLEVANYSRLQLRESTSLEGV